MEPISSDENGIWTHNGYMMYASLYPSIKVTFKLDESKLMKPIDEAEDKYEKVD
jgi:hypothetical protein